MHAVAIRHWELDPLVIVPLALTAVLYTAGLSRVWWRAGAGRGIAPWNAAAFAAGWLVAATALVSPIAWLSEILFSVHMTQHTLLMLVAAPLMAFGQPLLAWLWAFPAGARDRLAAVFRAAPVSSSWHRLSAPLTVFLLQAAALWLWHLPSLYQLALHDDGVHALQHLSFVISASLFWWAMVYGRYGRRGYGLAVLYVFLTAVHSGALGSLLTFAPAAWYDAYVRQGSAWRIDPLADQQLAGLLMWIPASVIFIVLGLALFAAWLGEAERCVRFGATDAASRM
jgi:putative membrane protein